MTPQEYVSRVRLYVNGLAMFAKYTEKYTSGNKPANFHPLYARIDANGFIVGPDVSDHPGMKNIKFKTRPPISSKNLKTTVAEIYRLLDDPTGTNTTETQKRIEHVERVIDNIKTNFEAWLQKPGRPFEISHMYLGEQVSIDSEPYRAALEAPKEEGGTGLTVEAIRNLVDGFEDTITAYIAWHKENRPEKAEKADDEFVTEDIGI